MTKRKAILSIAIGIVILGLIAVIATFAKRNRENELLQKQLMDKREQIEHRIVPLMVISDEERIPLDFILGAMTVDEHQERYKKEVLDCFVEIMKKQYDITVDADQVEQYINVIDDDDNINKYYGRNDDESTGVAFFVKVGEWRYHYKYNILGDTIKTLMIGEPGVDIVMVRNYNNKYIHSISPITPGYFAPPVVPFDLFMCFQNEWEEGILTDFPYMSIVAMLKYYHIK